MGLALIVNGARWQIGDGKIVCIWQDKWLTSTTDGLLHLLIHVSDFVAKKARDIISIADRNQNLLLWKLPSLGIFHIRVVLFGLGLLMETTQLNPVMLFAMLSL